MASSMVVFVKTLVVFSVLFTRPAQADEFLAARVSPEEIKQQLHNELKTLLGHGDPESVARLGQLQAQIKPLFLAMPKNAGGDLDPAVARYALHRYFVHKHGWHVRGLEVTGAEKESGNTSTDLSEEHISDYVMQLLMQEHSNRIGLRELAVVAAVLEDVVHSEAIELLIKAYNVQELSVERVVIGKEEEQVLETYLLNYLMPNPRLDALSKDGLNSVISQAPHFYTGWTDTITWMQDLRDLMDFDDLSRRNPFIGRLAGKPRQPDLAKPLKWPVTKPRTFESVVRLVEKIGEEFGQYQNLECRTLKNSLLDLSDASGRVPLSKFYKAAYEKRSQQFAENPDYLRHLGVLDETDPKRPSLIVTNYVYARSNCLASSGLYHICCIDECEALMAHLELSIAHPLADPEKVAELVPAIASDTVAAPRNLSATLRGRLDDIAQRHGGSVPLHGRLFAQWMHHAFPNECRYPHPTGSFEPPQSPLEWLATRRLKASSDEMEAFINAAPPAEAVSDAEELAPPPPWSDEEELVAAGGHHSPALKGKLSAWLRVVGLALPMCSVGAMLVRTLGSAATAGRLADGQLLEKQMV